MTANNGKWNSKLCFYCGENEKQTMDHVVPKGWFRKPRPSNLITVPSCDPCNSSYEKDEELVRIYLVNHHRANEEADSIREEKVLRGLAREEGQLLLGRVVDSFQRVNLESPSGIWLGQQLAMKLETDRFERVMRKIAWGLYYGHYQERLPEETVIRVLDISERDWSPIWSLMRYRNSMGRTIRYRYDRMDDRPETSFWFLEFYEGARCLCAINADDLLAGMNVEFES